MGGGQLLNGLAGPVTQAAPTLLSSTWFPSEQRTTATAVAALCSSLGVAISFVIGPLVVTDIKLELDSMRPDKGNLTRNQRFALFPSFFSVMKKSAWLKKERGNRRKGWELTSLLGVNLSAVQRWLPIICEERPTKPRYKNVLLRLLGNRCFCGSFLF